jgi:tetratricopeptide (TPR) repeat protein
MAEFFSAFRWSLHLAAWATPRIGGWTLEHGLNRVEGERLLKSRNFPEAEKFLARAVADADAMGHNGRRFQFRLELAEAQREQAPQNSNKLEEAETTVREALEITARASNAAGYVMCLDALAEVFHKADNFTAMETVLQEAVRIEASLSHPEPLRMARRIHRLGVARHKNGHSDTAIPALQKALQLHEQVYGPEHVETGDLLSELGAIFRAQQNHELAQDCLRRALRIHEDHHGHHAEQTVRDMHHLAGSLEESGNIEGAAELYERSLMQKLLLVGGDLEEIAEMQFGLAGIYIGWANYARARELLSEAIGIFLRKKGPRLAVTYETLAHVEECSGRYLEAVTELAKAAKVWEADGRTIELVENLLYRADLLDQMRKKREATWLRERAEELTEKAQAQSA